MYNIKNQIETIKEMYATKAFLACLLIEHAEEFKGMGVEEVRKCIKEVMVSSKKVYDTEDIHDIYFTVQSPQVEEEHEIVVCLEIRLKPEESNKKMPVEVERTVKMHLEKKIELTDIKIKSYAFWFYLDPPIENQHTNVRYTATLNSIGNEYFDDEKSEVFIMNLGDPTSSNYVH